MKTSFLFSPVAAFLLTCMPQSVLSAPAQDKVIITERGAGYEPVARTIRNISDLLEAKPRDLYGRRVELTGAQVQAVLDPKTIFVGPSAQELLLVRLQSDRPPLMRPGDKVFITGILRDTTDTIQRWELIPAHREQVRKYPIYIDGVKVQPMNINNRK